MIDGLDLTFIAASDLSAKQYRLVKFTATEGQVDVCAATTDIAIGVLQNNPKTGQAAVVRFYGKTWLSGGVALAVGNAFCTDVNGQGAVFAAGTDTTKYGKGIITKAMTNAGELAEAYLIPIARGA